jgi:hypothetical protein
VSRVPPSASGSTSGAENELEKLEELGDDAIVAHQQGAHVPKPRAQVTEEARSIVISDQSSPGNDAPAPPERRSRRRSERTEKTVVIRSRRQIDELRRAMAKHKPPGASPAKRGLLLWVIVGLAAFLAGGLVALFATPAKRSAPTAAPVPVASDTAQTPIAPSASAEPPSVSIDELPIEGQKKK